MPKNEAKPSVLAKLGDAARKAHDKVKGSETRQPKGSNLPAGIEGGEAVLSDMKLDIYKDGPNKGKAYFYAAGIVTAPTHFEGQRIEGKRTQISEPMYDTPKASKKKTIQDHLDEVENVMRLLGVDTANMPFEEIENEMAALVKAAPKFYFRTWKGKKKKKGEKGYNPKFDSPEAPEPRINHVWEGLVESDTEEGEVATDHELVGDESGEPGDEAADTDAVQENEEAAESESGEETTEPTLQELGDMAQKGDKDAKLALEAKAKEVGVPAKEVKGADSWHDVVSLINSKLDEKPHAVEQEEENVDEVVEEETVEEEVVEEEANPYEPGTTFGYKPLGPDKKPGKQVQVEVLEHDADKNVVKIKAHGTNKVYGNVPVARLISATK